MRDESKCNRRVEVAAAFLAMLLVELGGAALFTGSAWASEAAPLQVGREPLPALPGGRVPRVGDIALLGELIADRRTEIMIAFDRRGDYIGMFEGKKDSVDVPLSLAARLRRGILLHNHPSGAPPSAIDYLMTFHLRIQVSYVARRTRTGVAVDELRFAEAARRQRPGAKVLLRGPTFPG